MKLLAAAVACLGIVLPGLAGPARAADPTVVPDVAKLAPAAGGALDEAESLLQAQRTRPDAARFERARRIAAAEVERLPDDPRAWRTLAWARMLEHRFAEARDAAQTAARLAPADARALALLSDALVELGRYAEAVAVTDRLAEIEPGIPAWVRAAHLRFLFGDLAGAIDLMAMAARAGAPRGEASAWTWLDLARLNLHAGKPAAAGEAIAMAARADPGSPALLSARASLKLAQGDAHAALDLYRQALAARPSAEDALAAWQLARQLGLAGVAKHQAALLEGLARLDSAPQSRRSLAEYFSASGRNGRALELARQEFDARPDIYSHATLARVLAGIGEQAEAQRQAHLALALNTPDRQLRADMQAILDAPDRPPSREARR